VSRLNLRPCSLLFIVYRGKAVEKMKLTVLFNLVQRLGMSGVIVHSAIRLNLNLQFLSVGLSNV